MKINRNNVDNSSLPKTEPHPESAKPSVITSKGIATAKDAFTDASSDESKHVTSVMVAANNPSGLHNTVVTNEGGRRDARSALIPQRPQVDEQNAGWAPGEVFKSDSGAKVKISAADVERQTIARKDDDDD